jgi:hypothetical protein
MQPFCGELFIEDPNLGKKSLYPLVGENLDGEVVIELHNANPPNGISTLIGRYGDAWSLKRVGKGFLVTVYELSFLHETPSVKARCVTGHKFGRMLEAAIERLKTKIS